jgi:uncharacterized protein
MADLKMSRFIAEVPIEKDGMKFIAAFQTMTGSLIAVPKMVWSTIKSNPGQTPPDMIAPLIRQGFLLRREVNEDAVLTNYKQQIVQDFSTVKVKIVLTRLCNCACTYCIVKAEGKNMSVETALAVNRFCYELVRKKRARKVEYLYSGGDPLLNWKIFLKSVSSARDQYEGSGIEFEFSFITNGMDLTPEIASALVKLGLKVIRVSIAGPGPVHNKLRPPKDVARYGTEPYDLIMGNMEAISALGVSFIVLVQYDSSSDDYLLIPDMLDDIKRRSLPVQNVHITPIIARRDETTFKGMMGDPEIYLSLMKEAEKRGFPQFQNPPFNACAADIRGRFTFDTDGSIMACTSMQSGEMVYGHVSTGIDFVEESQLLQRKYPEKCLKSCALLPRCWGGCRLNALARGEDFSSVDCQEEVLRLILEEHIRRKALAALSSGNVPVTKEAA